MDGLKNLDDSLWWAPVEIIDIQDNAFDGLSRSNDLAAETC